MAGLARGKMKAKRAALAGALSGQFDDHPAGPDAPDQIGALTVQIGSPPGPKSWSQCPPPPAAWTPPGASGPGAGEDLDAAVRPAIARLEYSAICPLRHRNASAELRVAGSGRLVLASFVA
jgi:hypothetical protein